MALPMGTGLILDMAPAPMAGAVGSGAQPMLRFVGNAELEAIAESERRREEAVVNSLSAHILKLWEEARRAKRDIEDEMLKDYRQRQGIYDPKELADIREQGGSEIFVMLTSVKCEALAAWLSDIEFQPDENPWSLDPSPMADLPPEKEVAIQAQVTREAEQAFLASGGMIDINALRNRVEELRDAVREEIQAEAGEAAERMTQVVEDDLLEGDWETSVREAIDDLATTKAGIVHGPIYRRKRVMKWMQTPQGWRVKESTEIRKMFERVSPFDIYPSPDATSPDNGYLFHHQRLHPSHIEAMIGVPGFNEAEIRASLDDHQVGGLKNWMAIDTERRKIEQRVQAGASQGETIDTLCFWGKLPGQLLLEWGWDDPTIDKNGQYDVNLWQIGSRTIGVTLNQAPGGKRPYSMASFRKIPGSFWGEGLAHEIRDCQRMCNAAARGIANNSGLASGPQVVINDSSRLPPNEDPTNIYPWKLWQFGPDNGSTSNRPPVEFFQPPSVVSELMGIFNEFAAMADNVSGVPNYSHGNDNVHGAGKTASGLSMLMTNASRGIKDVIKRIDRGIIERTVWMTYALNMVHNEDELIKGDLNVVVRGSSSLIAKEQQQVRRTEFLQMTNNPVDLQITGLAGRATVLRETAKSLELPLDEVVPDPEDMRVQAETGRMQEVLNTIAGALGIPLNQIIAAVRNFEQAQLMQQGGAGPTPQGGGQEALLPGGMAAGGMNAATF